MMPKLIDRIRSHFADTKVWYYCDPDNFGCGEYVKLDPLVGKNPVHGEDHDGHPCSGVMYRKAPKS